MLVDSHCHLDYLQKDGDLAQVLSRAQAAGVAQMVTICTKVSDFETVHQIACANEQVYCSVGVHPHEAETEASGLSLDLLLEKAALPRVVGIGETGLDYYYDHADRAVQRSAFRTHIAAARETGLPLIVHSRDADEDTIAIMQDEAGKGAFPGLIHCFTAGPALARAALDLGLYISLSGIVTFKSATALREAIRGVPLDRILIETDSPYLAPVPQRGKRNEPAFVGHVADYLAEFYGQTRADFVRQTGENFHRAFAKVPRTMRVAQ